MSNAHELVTSVMAGRDPSEAASGYVQGDLKEFYPAPMMPMQQMPMPMHHGVPPMGGGGMDFDDESLGRKAARRIGQGLALYGGARLLNVAHKAATKDPETIKKVASWAPTETGKALVGKALELSADSREEMAAEVKRQKEERKKRKEAEAAKAPETKTESLSPAQQDALRVLDAVEEQFYPAPAARNVGWFAPRQPYEADPYHVLHAPAPPPKKSIGKSILKGVGVAAGATAAGVGLHHIAKKSYLGEPGKKAADWVSAKAREVVADTKKRGEMEAGDREALRRKKEHEKNLASAEARKKSGAAGTSGIEVAYDKAIGSKEYKDLQSAKKKEKAQAASAAETLARSNLRKQTRAAERSASELRGHERSIRGQEFKAGMKHNIKQKGLFRGLHQTYKDIVSDEDVGPNIVLEVAWEDVTPKEAANEIVANLNEYYPYAQPGPGLHTGQYYPPAPSHYGQRRGFLRRNLGRLARYGTAAAATAGLGYLGRELHRGAEAYRKDPNAAPTSSLQRAGHAVAGWANRAGQSMTQATTAPAAQPQQQVAAPAAAPQTAQVNPPPASGGAKAVPNAQPAAAPPVATAPTRPAPAPQAQPARDPDGVQPDPGGARARAAAQSAPAAAQQAQAQARPERAAHHQMHQDLAAKVQAGTHTAADIDQILNVARENPHALKKPSWSQRLGASMKARGEARAKAKQEKADNLARETAKHALETGDVPTRGKHHKNYIRGLELMKAEKEAQAKQAPQQGEQPAAAEPQAAAPAPETPASAEGGTSPTPAPKPTGGPVGDYVAAQKAKEATPEPKAKASEYKSLKSIKAGQREKEAISKAGGKAADKAAASGKSDLAGAIRKSTEKYGHLPSGNVRRMAGTRRTAEAHGVKHTDVSAAIDAAKESLKAQGWSPGEKKAEGKSTSKASPEKQLADLERSVSKTKPSGKRSAPPKRQSWVEPPKEKQSAKKEAEPAPEEKPKEVKARKPMSAKQQDDLLRQLASKARPKKESRYAKKQRAKRANRKERKKIKQELAPMNASAPTPPLGKMIFEGLSANDAALIYLTNMRNTQELFGFKPVSEVIEDPVEEATVCAAVHAPISALVLSQQDPESAVNDFLDVLHEESLQERYADYDQSHHQAVYRHAPHVVSHSPATMVPHHAAVHYPQGYHPYRAGPTYPSMHPTASHGGYNPGMYPPQRRSSRLKTAAKIGAALLATGGLALGAHHVATKTKWGKKKWKSAQVALGLKKKPVRRRRATKAKPAAGAVAEPKEVKATATTGSKKEKPTAKDEKAAAQVAAQAEKVIKDVAGKTAKDDESGVNWEEMKNTFRRGTRVTDEDLDKALDDLAAHLPAQFRGELGKKWKEANRHVGRSKSNLPVEFRLLYDLRNHRKGKLRANKTRKKQIIRQFADMMTGGRSPIHHDHYPELKGEPAPKRELSPEHKEKLAAARRRRQQGKKQ